MARLVAFSRLLVRTVGDPALRRLIPVYCGLAMLVAVLFGPTGMSAEQLILGMDASPRFRVGLWLAWVVLVVSPTRLLFHNPNAVYLRSFPVGRSAHWLILAVLAVLVQLPWTWLWLRGAGVQAAAMATLTGAAVCVVAAIRGRSWYERALALGAIAALFGLIASDVDQDLLAAFSTAVLSVAVPIAWLRAPERRRALDVSATMGGRAGLLVVYITAVFRTRASSLGRGVVLAGLGGALTGLIARNNDIVSGDGVSVLALIFVTVLGGAAIAMVVGPVLDAERRMRWMLDANGTSAERRMLASAVVSAVAGVAYAAVFAGVMLWVVPLSWASVSRLAVTVIPMGAFVGLIELRCARWAERAHGIDGARLVAATVGVVLVVVASVGVLREWAVVLAGAAALKVTFSSVEHTLNLSRRGRWLR